LETDNLNWEWDQNKIAKSFEVDWKKSVQKKIKEFKETIPTKEQWPMRKKFLEKEVEAGKEMLRDLKQKRLEFLMRGREDWFDFFCSTDEKKIKKMLKRCQLELNWAGKSEGEITGEMIERANEVDCKNLFDSCEERGDRSYVLCPFHEDKNPSLVCYGKGKGFYCHGCGSGGDAIHAFMRLNNCDFLTAVRELQKY